METFDELSERLAADPAPHQIGPMRWNPKAHERWQRKQADRAVEWLLSHPAPGASRSDVEQVVYRLGRAWGALLVRSRTRCPLALPVGASRRPKRGAPQEAHPVPDGRDLCPVRISPARRP